MAMMAMNELNVSLGSDERLEFGFEGVDRRGEVTFTVRQAGVESRARDLGSVRVLPEQKEGLGKVVASAAEQLRDGLVASLDAIIAEHRTG